MLQFSSDMMLLFWEKFQYLDLDLGKQHKQVLLNVHLELMHTLWWHSFCLDQDLVIEPCCESYFELCASMFHLRISVTEIKIEELLWILWLLLSLVYEIKMPELERMTEILDHIERMNDVMLLSSDEDAFVNWMRKTVNSLRLFLQLPL